MFQCNINYPYKKAFDDIEQIICNNTANEIWKPYVARHKAIYEYKIRKTLGWQKNFTRNNRFTRSNAFAYQI